MQWASAISTEVEFNPSINEVIQSVKSQLNHGEPDIIVIFISTQHQEDFDKVPSIFNREFPSALLIGCSTEGVIEAHKDAEETPSISIMAGILPDVEIAPFYIENDMLSVASTFSNIEDLVQASAEKENHFILFSDPYTFDIENFLKLIDRHMIYGKKFGSMAGGGEKAGDNALFLGGKVHHSGLIGLSLTGNIRTEIINLQGYKPLGDPLFITKHQENIIHEFDSKSNSDILNEIFDSLDEESQDQFKHNLLIGLLQPQALSSKTKNQFLLRNILGLEPKSRGIIVGAPLDPNMIAQFFIKDKASCQNNVRETFATIDPLSKDIKGVMTFSCLDRGAELYHQSLYEVEELQKIIGEHPLAGMFGSGEIAPLGNQTVLHGYSSVFVLFSEKESN